MQINTTQSPHILLKAIPPRNLSVAVVQRATGKPKLLDVAVSFRYGNRDAVAEYPEGELALVDLFRESSQPRYRALAAFFTGQCGPRKVNFAARIRSSAPLKAIWQEDLLGKTMGIRAQGLWMI
jgi:hypothetical protein